MKAWFYSLLGLLIFCVFALIAQVYIGKTTVQLRQAIQKAEQAVQQQRWNPATRELQLIKKRWHKTEPVWALFLHHAEIDAIAESLVKAEQAVRSREPAESNIELGCLKYFINHVPKREGLNFVNIF